SRACELDRTCLVAQRTSLSSASATRGHRCSKRLRSHQSQTCKPNQKNWAGVTSQQTACLGGYQPCSSVSYQDALLALCCVARKWWMLLIKTKLRQSRKLRRNSRLGKPCGIGSLQSG